MRDGETILYLAYPLIERQHQERRYLTSHAAAFSFGNAAFLILGKEGAGKTSTLISMCQRFGAKLMANDLCVIGWKGEEGLAVHGGTKFFFIRRESARRTLPQLLPYFKEDGDDSWLEKAIICPKDLGVELEARELSVNMSFLVHVDETKRELFGRAIDDLPTRLYLNENFSRYIRTASTTMLGGDKYDLLGYVPSLDTKRFYEWRRELIKYLLVKQGVRYVSGPLPLVAEGIAKLCRKVQS